MREGCESDVCVLYGGGGAWFAKMVVAVFALCDTWLQPAVAWPQLRCSDTRMSARMCWILSNVPVANQLQSSSQPVMVQSP